MDVELLMLAVPCGLMGVPTYDWISMPDGRTMPDYERIIETIVARIRAGVYPPGTKIPSIAQLAEEFAVSPATVASVERTMRREGYLRGHAGKGVFVADEPPVA